MGDETMNATQAINVWDAKAMQDKLSEVVEMMFAAGLDEKAREMLRVFDTVLEMVDG
jgi:hypothetical protein